ncbi:MFS transporter [Promicromonospora sp. NPDC023805]|uniref:MFS transporter n=1 Tax=Promicromonospora sp. NPDC023805 TaxID=3154696 RepID=UPI0033EE8179
MRPEPHESSRPFAHAPARRLVVSNAFDAASRNAVDLVIDTTAVIVVGAGAFQIGLLNAAGSIAFSLLGVPIGVLIDRADARTAMTISAGARALLCVGLALLLASGQVTFWLLAAMSLLVGISGAVSETGQTVHATEVVPRGVVGTLVARLQSADSVLALAIPAVVGVALGAWAPEWSVGAAALASALAAVVLLGRRRATTRIRAGTAGPSRGRRPKGRFGAEVREGIAVFRSDAVLRRLTWSSALTNFGLAAFSSIATILVLRTLDLGTAAYGLLVTLGAAGGLVGSLIAARSTRRLSRAAVVSVATTALALVATIPLVALWAEPAAFVLMGVHAVLWGLFIVLGNVQIAALVAARVPHEKLGRVAAFRRSVTFSVVPVGGVLGGLVAGWLGIPSVVIGSIAASVLAAILAWTARRGL